MTPYHPSSSLALPFAPGLPSLLNPHANSYIRLAISIYSLLLLYYRCKVKINNGKGQCCAAIRTIFGFVANFHLRRSLNF
jgi:hypothetical protein